MTKLLDILNIVFLDNEEEYNLLIDEYYEIIDGAEEQDK